MKTYGASTEQKNTRFPVEALVSVSADEEQSGWRSTDIGLLLTSSGSFFVVVYAAVCHILSSNLIPLNIRPIPIQYMSDGSFVKDSEVDKPWVSSGMSYGALLWFCFGIPAAVLIVSAAINPIRGDVRAAVHGFTCALATTQLTTDMIKHYVGRLRPIFFAKCEFSFTEDCTGSQYHYLRESFPSGHSSNAMCAMLFVTLYLLGKVGPASSPIYTRLLPQPFGSIRFGPFLKWLATVPVWLAVAVAASRVHDNWHHPSDVIAGCVLGAGVAAFWYSVGYPGVSCADSHVPVVSPCRSHDGGPLREANKAEEQHLLSAKQGPE